MFGFKLLFAYKMLQCIYGTIWVNRKRNLALAAVNQWKNSTVKNQWDCFSELWGMRASIPLLAPPPQLHWFFALAPILCIIRLYWILWNACSVLSVRFEVGVSLLLAPTRADKRGLGAPFPLVENAGIQLAICKRVPAGALAGAGSLNESTACYSGYYTNDFGDFYFLFSQVIQITQ